MNKLKALFKKLKPEDPVAIAIVQTFFYVVAFIFGLVILIKDPAVFTLLLMLAVVAFVIKELFTILLRKAVKKTERKLRR